MSRSFVLFTLFIFSALAAPAAQAQLQFDLVLDSDLTSPGGSGSILLDANPVNGDYTVAALNPHIFFQYNGLTFTEASISDPATAVVRLSGNDTLRRFQFVETTNFSAFVFFDTLDSMGNNVELSFNPDAYFNGEVGAHTYSALASAASPVPEPSSIALLLGMGVTSTLLARRRTASRVTA